MDKTIKKFGDYLRYRLENNLICNEDTIRYTFYASLLQTTNLKVHNITLEYPLSDNTKETIDTYSFDSEGNEKIYEFKYDRKIPSQKNQPRTQKAGKVFNDLFRLADFRRDINLERVFIYVTDKEMATYFSNKKNGLNDFYNLNEQDTILVNDRYLCTKPKSFMNIIKRIIPVIITCLYRSSNLPLDHEIRIFKIEKSSDGNKV